MRPFLVWIVFLEIFAGGGYFLMQHLDRQVQASQSQVEEFDICIDAAPGWMPDSLMKQIEQSMSPAGLLFSDKALAGEVYRLAEANPWVKRVVRVEKQTRDDRGVVVVVAEFRKPLARVLGDVREMFVDEEGVVLPSHQAPRYAAWVEGSEDGRTDYYVNDADIPPGSTYSALHFVVISGASGLPPPVGCKWASADLAAGINLVKLVMGRSYASQITVVDVRNYNGRISAGESHLRMYAQVGKDRPTDIRFGRFPNPGGADYVISPDRKMLYLDSYAEDHNGRIAGFHSYLDLRYDHLHVSIN
ncbi:MAG: hypothetical protein HZA50_15880 [Planctomycetes bacterium]|nr:hypothetical protein [Planctomycetota bacterium]